MTIHWIAVRADGSLRQAEGPEGWEQVIEHADVAEPDRLRTFAYHDDERGPSVVLQLRAGERLCMARRRQIVVSADGEEQGRPPPKTVLGVVRPSGEGLYLFIHDEDGSITVSSDLNAV